MQIAILVAVLCAAPQLPAPLTQSTEQQPVVSDMLRVAGEPLRPASGWALNPTGELAADGVVSGQGLGVRIRSATDVTVYRPAWKLTGQFAVGALFQSSQPTATYGLTLGGASGLTLLVRNDGRFAIRGTSANLASAAWAPVALRHATAPEVAGANRLEVRVGAADVRFVINGQTVRVMPITAGQLDGSPGVYVGAAGDVNVAGFTVEAATVLQPSAIK